MTARRRWSEVTWSGAGAALALSGAGAVALALAVTVTGCSSSHAHPVSADGAAPDSAPSDSAPSDSAASPDHAPVDSAAADSAPADSAPPDSVPLVGEVVLERNNHPSRDGHFIQPSLTRAAAARMALDASFTAILPGGLYGSPLYLEKGPGGRGAFYAGDASNAVTAFDETTGAIIWTKTVGMYAASNGQTCGDVHPLGITSTPVIDLDARTIFVAAAVGQTVTERHEVHALSVDDGAERPGWPVNLATIKAGAVVLDSPPQNQRSALSLVRGILYIAFGGHAGDCGTYRGWVMAIDTKDPTHTGAFTTGGTGEGIWAQGGMASDGDGVFAVTGNAIPVPTVHADSEEVVRITGLGIVDRSTNKNIFFPAEWRGLDVADADLGASSSLYFEDPASTPSKIVVAVSKAGRFYLLDSQNLGGMDGHLAMAMVSTGSPGVHTAPAAFRTTGGLRITLGIDAGAECPGGVGGSSIMAVALTSGAPPKVAPLWCVPRTGKGSPIATTTDGTHEAIVWFLNGDNKLMAVDGETGQALFNGGADACPRVSQPWISPIAVKGRIIVGANGQLCSWSPH